VTGGAPNPRTLWGSIHNGNGSLVSTAGLVATSVASPPAWGASGAFMTLDKREPIEKTERLVATIAAHPLSTKRTPIAIAPSVDSSNGISC
jgi:hypothetical protein